MLTAFSGDHIGIFYILNYGIVHNIIVLLSEEIIIFDMDCNYHDKHQQSSMVYLPLFIIHIEYKMPPTYI